MTTLFKSNLIKVNAIDGGYSVRFPYELKDSFKAVFKSATWNAAEKNWEVGRNSKTRLKQWIEMVKGVTDDLETVEADDMTAAQIDQVYAEVARVRAEIDAARREREIYGNSRTVLAAAVAELEKAKAELDAERQAAAVTYAEARAFVEKACDINAVHAAHAVMKRNHGKIGTKFREQYQAAQGVIRKECKRLNAVGFVSEGMEMLANFSFNRPDRDEPDEVKDRQIFNLLKYTPGASI